MSDPKKDLTPQAQHEMATVKIDAADLSQMFGEFEREDLTIPRLQLLQSMSPEVDDGLGKPGDLFVKGQNRNLGKADLEFIPLMRSKSRILWKDLSQGGGILCQAHDGKTGVGAPGGTCDVCPMQEWHGKDKPQCDVYQNIIVVFRRDEEWFPVAVSGARTKLKPLRELNNLLALELNKQRPLFAKSYFLKVIEKSSKTGKKYFTFAITPANQNQVLPIEEQERAYGIFQKFKGVVIQADAGPEVNEESHAAVHEKEF